MVKKMINDLQDEQESQGQEFALDPVFPPLHGVEPVLRGYGVPPYPIVADGLAPLTSGDDLVELSDDIRTSIVNAEFQQTDWANIVPVLARHGFNDYGVWRQATVELHTRYANIADSIEKMRRAALYAGRSTDALYTYRTAERSLLESLTHAHLFRSVAEYYAKKIDLANMSRGDKTREQMKSIFYQQLFNAAVDLRVNFPPTVGKVAMRTLMSMPPDLYEFAESMIANPPELERFMRDKLYSIENEIYDEIDLPDEIDFLGELEYARAIFHLPRSTFETPGIDSGEST